jgi:predicted nucleic acid-binding protein
MRLLLDTTILIAWRKRDTRIEQAIRERRERAEEIGISRLTELELREGAMYLWKKHEDAKELAWIDDILEWLKIYEIDEDTIRNASDVQGEALVKGNPFPDMDLLIALSAKAGSELLTTDTNQLKMVNALRKKGIRVTSP